MRALVTGRNLLALLLAGTLAAAYFFWNIERQSHQLITTEDIVASRLEHMSDLIAGIGTAQQSYVAPGQLDEPWFERMSALVQQLSDEVTAVGPMLRSPDAPGALMGLVESTDAVMATDRRTRQNLSLGQDLMAADVIFSDGRNILDAMIARVHDLQRAERAYYGAELAGLSRERWLVLGLLSLGWVGAIGVIGAVGRGFTLRHPSTVARGALSPVEGQAGREGPPSGDERAATRSGPAAAPADPGPYPSVDLSAAAALCTDVSRVTDTAGLAGLLGRAASILDASGAIVWMSAGDQLFAVLGHGYPPEVVGRFGPLGRAADNAAAAAWRTGRLTVVTGTDTTSGGLVAPMFGPERCIGVLALEMRSRREQDPVIQAVAGMIAAQLAAAVSAWPAASHQQAPADPAEARSA